MVPLKEIIKQQIGRNSRLNLLYTGKELHFEFSEALKELIHKIGL